MTKCEMMVLLEEVADKELFVLKTIRRALDRMTDQDRIDITKIFGSKMLTALIASEAGNQEFWANWLSERGLLNDS